MLLEAFSWHGLGSLVPSEGKVTANQHNVILMDHLYPMLRLWKRMQLISYRMSISTSTGHRGSLNGLSVKMM